MQFLRQSTASQVVRIGPFVDDTDFKTAETGLSIANTDIKIFSNAATATANKNSGGATHAASGWYYLTLDATDSATLGRLELFVAVSGALPVWATFMVLPANVYDALVLGTDYLEIDVTQWKGATAPAMTGDAFARLGAPAGASTAADIAAVKAQTAAIEADTGTDGVVVASGSKTGYSLTATTGLGNQTSNITGNLSGSVGSVTGAVGSVTGNVGGNVAGSVGSVTGAVGSVTGNVGGNVAGSVGSVTGAVGSVTGNVGGNVTGSVGSLATQAKTDAGDAVLDEVVEGTTTLRESIRGINSATMGKASGLDTTNPKYRDLADSKDRIDATVDADGNRTAVTRDLT